MYGSVSYRSVSQSIQSESPLTQTDLLIKIIGGAVAVVTAILGLPVAWIQFHKARVEIKKIELESQKLASDLSENASSDANRHRIIVDGNRNIVNIFTDPRLFSPMLLLVDFVIAYLYLLVVDYAIVIINSIGPFGVITNPIRFAIIMFIFYPIFRTAQNVRKTMQDMTTEQTGLQDKNNGHV